MSVYFAGLGYKPDLPKEGRTVLVYVLDVDIPLSLLFVLSGPIVVVTIDSDWAFDVSNFGTLEQNLSVLQIVNGLLTRK